MGVLKAAAARMGVLVLLACLSGCGAGVLKQQARAIRVAPIAAEYQLAGPPQGRAYVLLAETGTGQEQYRHAVSNSLAMALDQSTKSLEVRSFSDFANKLNEGGLAARYARMRSFYRSNGLFEKPDLNAMAHTTGADYLVQPNLLVFRQWAESRFSALGLKLLKTQISHTTVSMELWDAKTGYKVCDITAEATVAGEQVREKTISVDETLKRAWSRLIKELPH